MININKINIFKNRVKKPASCFVENNLCIVISNNTKNRFIFNKEYFGLLNGLCWSEDNKGYLRTFIYSKPCFAHHLIIGKPKRGYVVDHIDRNIKNNTKENLRITIYQVNVFNSTFLEEKKESKYIGVVKSGDKCRARIHHNNQNINITFCDSEILAALSYDKMAIILHGSSAITNLSLNKITKDELLELGYHNIDEFKIPIPILKQNKSSKYIGVTLNKKENKWYSYCTINKNTTYLGGYKYEIEAAFAYDNFIISNKSKKSKTNYEIGLLSENDYIINDKIDLLNKIKNYILNKG